MPAKNKVNAQSILLRMHPLQRMLLSLLISAVVFFIIKGKYPSLIIAMAVWDAFSLAYLSFCWIVFATRPIAEIRKLAKKDDGSTIFIFVLILASSLASMFTVLLLMLSQEDQSSTNKLYLPVAVAGMLLSWLMVHSTYVFHYAHMYYDDDKDNPGKDAYGLDFPGDAKPNYIDFVYFSYVIACTFQVSDVEITSPKIRRIVLFHGLLSFGLNTFVVALTINIIAGLSN